MTFEGKTEEQARQEILNLVAEFANTYRIQMILLPLEIAFRMLPVYTIVKRW